MITKQQALDAFEFHCGECTRTTGPRGGVREVVRRWRRTGATKTWKTRTGEFSVPVKYGMRDYTYITDDNAGAFHTVDDCPLTKEK